MNIKTIREYDLKEFDDAVNQFGKTHTIKFSQSHYHRDFDKKEIEVFVMVIFYEEVLTPKVDLLQGGY